MYDFEYIDNHEEVLLEYSNYVMVDFMTVVNQSKTYINYNLWNDNIIFPFHAYIL